MFDLLLFGSFILAASLIGCLFVLCYRCGYKTAFKSMTVFPHGEDYEDFYKDFDAIMSYDGNLSEEKL